MFKWDERFCHVIAAHSSSSLVTRGICADAGCATCMTHLHVIARRDDIASSRHRRR
jgi:hypothetical protein